MNFVYALSNYMCNVILTLVFLCIYTGGNSMFDTVLSIVSSVNVIDIRIIVEFPTHSFVSSESFPY
jgi:hypothetical protein